MSLKKTIFKLLSIVKYTFSVYYDPFLAAAAAAAQQDPNMRLQVKILNLAEVLTVINQKFLSQAASATPALLKTPLTQSQQAYSTAFNTARALSAAGLAQVQAQAQPVTAASYAALSG